jgi:hypothetical protein
MHADRKITIPSCKHLFTVYIPLLALTDRLMDRQNDGETNTLSAHGLEELFFQLCFPVSFFDFCGK